MRRELRDRRADRAGRRDRVRVALVIGLALAGLVILLMIAFISGGIYMDDLVAWLDKRRSR